MQARFAHCDGRTSMSQPTSFSLLNGLDQVAPLWPATRMHHHRLSTLSTLGMLLCTFAAEAVDDREAAWSRTENTRKQCAFGRGSLATVSVGPDAGQIPIKHVVVLMMENRSYDHYYSELKKYYPNKWSATDSNCVDVTSSASNLDSVGNRYSQTRATHYCLHNTGHEWSAIRKQFNGGAMDGFVRASEPNGDRAMFFYGESDIPFYYYLAKNFATSDRYFSPILGPTWPNRWFFYSASSYGRTKTPDVPVGPSELRQQADIVSKLKGAGRTVEFFRGGLAHWGAVGFADPTREGSSLSRFEEAAKSYTAAKPTLPDVSIIDPSFVMPWQFDKSPDSATDEHPPANIQSGQDFAARVVRAVASNDDVWKSTALFITYDEHGGLYDHVVPPTACDPADGHSAGKKDEDGYPAKFDHYGMRVPLLVLSAYGKRHYMSHHVADHTSITRFIEAKFGLPAMTARDANAFPLLDMFDFAAGPKLGDRRALYDEANRYASPANYRADYAAVRAREKAWCAANDPLDGVSSTRTCASNRASHHDIDAEPNDSTSTAKPLADPGCHNMVSSGKVATGTLACAGDVDYFYLDASDGYTCSVGPKATIATEHVEVCVFPICKNNRPASVHCDENSHADELGVLDKGCCAKGKGKKIEVEYSCKGTSDDSARVYYVVKPDGPSSSAIDYSFKYEY